MSRKRVVIDARMVGPVPHGFSRYVTQIGEGLRLMAKNAPLSYDPVFFVGRGTPSDAFAFETVRVGAPFLNPLEMLEIPVLLKRLGAGAYHTPTFSSLLSFPPSPCPVIQTVHDLNHLSFGGRGQKWYYERILKPFARKAAALVTVSEFSRKELSGWIGRSESRIEVVTNAIDPAYLYPMLDEEVDPVLRKYGLERGKYFLCLSNPKPHKNVDTLLRAHADARVDWPLVLSLKQNPPASGVIGLGPVPDSEARALLVSAGAVAFPSLYEGFGLPPVEAAIAGVPVLVSDIPPHREGLQELQAGEACWISPRDVSAWSQALQRAAAGALSAASMDSRTRTLARFDTAKMGRHMDRIYRDVLGLSPLLQPQSMP